MPPLNFSMGEHTPPDCCPHRTLSIPAGEMWCRSTGRRYACVPQHAPHIMDHHPNICTSLGSSYHGSFVLVVAAPQAEAPPPSCEGAHAAVRRQGGGSRDIDIPCLALFFILRSAHDETWHSPRFRCTIELGGGGVYLTYE